MAFPLDLKITETISPLLELFFKALQGDGTTLSSFQLSWLAFNDTVRLHHNTLRNETLVAVRDLIAVITTVSTNLLELEAASKKIGDELVNDITTILEEPMQAMSLDDTRQSLPLHDTPPHPPYLKQCYFWLLDNLHKPYPPKELKLDISRTAGCSIKDVDAWFSETRKRIGWNKIRRVRFGKKEDNPQENMLSAAAHILKGDIGTANHSFSCIDQTATHADDDLRADFIQMVYAAENLYPDIYSQYKNPNAVSTPAKQAVNVHSDKLTPHSAPYPTPSPSPDRVIESLPSTPPSMQTPKDKVSLKRRRSSSSNREIIEEELVKHEKRRRISDDCSHDLYALPSPAYSVPAEEEVGSPCMPTPLPASSHASGMAGKRKRTRAEDEFTQGSPKRLHISRQADAREDFIPLSCEVPETQAATALPTVVRSKRKRRLSDGETGRQSKRPHNALCVPRMQTTSNPLPAAQAEQAILNSGWDYMSNAHRLNDMIPSLANCAPGILPDRQSLHVTPHQYDAVHYQAGLFLSGSTFESNGFSTAPLSIQNDIVDSGHDHQEAFHQYVDLGHVSNDCFKLVPSVTEDGNVDFFTSQPEIFSSSTGFICDPNLLHYGHNAPAITVVQQAPLDAEQRAKQARIQHLRNELRILEEELSV